MSIKSPKTVQCPLMQSGRIGLKQSRIMDCCYVIGLDARKDYTIA